MTLKPFVDQALRPADCWRGVILFGRNVATYKFALGRSLLELRPAAGQLVTLEQLAVPFSEHLREHLRHTPKQGTSSKSVFLDACRRANVGEISQDELWHTTVKLGFKDVLDAFHVVGSNEIPLRFFEDERKGPQKGIRITKAFADLVTGHHGENLPIEVEARWRLVETAWELGVSPALLAVRRNADDETLFVVDQANRRRSITGARDALSGYQKGHCFYCFGTLTLQGEGAPDVDHFFPHCLKSAGFGERVDGIWNLVLACRNCNRGVDGKFHRVPTVDLLERLSSRNEYLINSNHPLRETIIAQSGDSTERRRSFLSAMHLEARRILVHDWEPKLRGEALF
jgi:hypothetical protein